jgi:hypothetical protein
VGEMSGMLAPYLGLVKRTHKKNLNHPGAQVRDRCGQKQVDHITDLTFEIIYRRKFL